MFGFLALEWEDGNYGTVVGFLAAGALVALAAILLAAVLVVELG